MVAEERAEVLAAMYYRTSFLYPAATWMGCPAANIIALPAPHGRRIRHSSGLSGGSREMRLQREPDKRVPVTGDRVQRSEFRPRLEQSDGPTADLGWQARRDLGIHPGLPESRWRRVLELWGFSAIPFFSAFDDPEGRS